MLLDIIEQTQDWAAFLGPNIFLQAVAIAVVFIVVGKIADLLISRIIAKLVSRSSNQFDDNLVRLLHRPVFITFVLIGLALATRRLGLSESPEYVTLGLLRTIAIVVWFTFFGGLAQLLLTAIRRGNAGKFVHKSMVPLLDTVIKVVLIALAVYFLFLAWNINVTAWIASAGIVGLALSFAAQDTLSNLFAGVSIAADAPYKTGDFINLNTGERGMVTHIGLRSTRILTRDDIEITIPNGVIANSIIVNEAGGPSPKHRIRIPIGVAYGSDIDQVMEVLSDIATAHAEVCSTPEPRVRFRKFGDSSLDFELLCWISKPVDRGRLIHEINCAIYKSFATENISIPFPQRDLHLRSMPPT